MHQRFRKLYSEPLISVLSPCKGLVELKFYLKSSEHTYCKYVQIYLHTNGPELHKVHSKICLEIFLGQMKNGLDILESYFRNKLCTDIS